MFDKSCFGLQFFDLWVLEMRSCLTSKLYTMYCSQTMKILKKTHYNDILGPIVNLLVFGAFTSI